MGFWRPEILASPNIPRALHTVNPRTILGKKWWDEQRQIAYAHHDYRCWACGVPKQNAEFYHWLEAHEDYNYNWKTGRVELKEIVALCHSCHSFIHNGRLYQLYLEGEISKDKVWQVLDHGLDICKRNNVKPYYGAFKVYAMLHGMPENEAEKYSKYFGWCPDVRAKWEDWHLIVEGEEYRSPFISEKEWKEYFEENY